MNLTIFILNMTRNRKRRAKRVIKIYKTDNIRKEVNIMEKEKKKFDWIGFVVKVIIAIISVITGAELGN